MENTKQISNPFREIGVLHNEGLDFVIKGLKPREVTIEKILKLTGEYLLKIEDSSKKSDLAANCQAVASTINQINQVSFEEILRETKVTREALCFINEIDNISGDFDFPTTLKIIENIEVNILLSEMTEKEKQIPLLFSAVAKSSVQYWIEQINDKKSAWIPFLGDDLERVRWPWKKDGLGALAGGAAGAITGGVTGGLLGALGGALGASIAEVLFPG